MVFQLRAAYNCNEVHPLERKRVGTVLRVTDGTPAMRGPMTDQDQDDDDMSDVIGWDPLTRTIPLYRTLAEAKAATKDPIVIDPANPSMDDDDISDLGD